MARTGLVLNLVGVALVTGYVYFVLVGVFGLPVEPPDWVH